jgi:hypothetical protein
MTSAWLTALPFAPTDGFCSDWRHIIPHWDKLPLLFWPLDRLWEQPPAGRKHVISPCRGRQLADPQLQSLSDGTLVSTLLSDFSYHIRPTGVQREVCHNTVHHIRTTLHLKLDLLLQWIQTEGVQEWGGKEDMNKNEVKLESTMERTT